MKKLFLVLISFCICEYCNAQLFKDSLYKNDTWYYTKDSVGIKSFYPLSHFFKYSTTVTGTSFRVSGKMFYADSCYMCVVSVTWYDNGSDSEQYLEPPKKWVLTKQSEFSVIKANTGSK